MKRILFSLMAVVLSLGLMGASFAYFSDVETSTGNTFTAGTLDLKVDGEDDGSTLVAVDIKPMAPGDPAAYNTWDVTNAGNILGDLKLTVSFITDLAGTTPEPEVAFNLDNGELSANLMVILFEDTNDNGVFDGTDVELYGDGSGGMALLDGMPGTYDPSDPAISGGSTVSITLRYELPSGTGNVVMDDSSSFNIQFNLDQS